MAKAEKKKKRGLPKGRTNNPHGRPPSVEAVGSIVVRLDSGTLCAVTGLERKWACSRSDVVRRSIREAAEREEVDVISLVRQDLPELERKITAEFRKAQARKAKK